MCYLRTKCVMTRTMSAKTDKSRYLLDEEVPEKETIFARFVRGIPLLYFFLVFISFLCESILRNKYQYRFTIWSVSC